MSRVIRPDARLIQEFVYTQQQLPTHRPVVQYIRQSSLAQVRRNRQSYEQQDSDLRRKLVHGYGWKDTDTDIIKIDADQGKSGTKRRDERTGLGQLYTLLEQDKAGAVATFDISRLYRVLSKAEYGAFCDLVLERNIPVITDSRIYWPNQTDNNQLADDFRLAAMYVEDFIKGKVNAAKYRHIQYDVSYGGNAIPFGYIVPTLGRTKDVAPVKSYVVYEPHARLVRWLFRRFRELGGNLPLLGKELKQIDFRFPPFEPGIAYHVSLRQDPDGSFPLRSRDALIGILTNVAYIGWYLFSRKDEETGEKLTTIVSKQAHDAIILMDDFLFAYARLSSVSLDGIEQERKPRERRYGGATALLDGIVASGDIPVYVLNKQYVAQPRNNGWKTQELVVDVANIDDALAPALVALLARIEQERRDGLREALRKQVEDIRKANQKRADEYDATLARIDKEIGNAEMARRVCQQEGDENGYREATRQLVQLRKDRSAVEAKASQASTEARDLADCHDLLDCAIRDWETMAAEKRKRLVKLLMPAADMTAPSPHFIHLQCLFVSPINAMMELYIYRKHGSRHVWMDSELDTLQALFPVATKGDIMQALPDCSWVAINQKAQKMGLHRDAPYVLEPALTWSDTQFMAETGASMEEVVWRMTGIRVDENDRLLLE